MTTPELTVEQLKRLLAVAEKVSGPFVSTLHEVTWRQEFREQFNPAVCVELVREVLAQRTKEQQ